VTRQARFFIGGFLTLLLLVPQLRAASETQLVEGEAMVKKVIDILNKMHPTKDPLTPQQTTENEHHKDSIGQMIDIETMSRVALDKHYSKTNSNDLSTFKDLFKRLVVKSATANTSSNKVKIVIRQKTFNKNQNILITTKVRRRGDDPILMKYEIKPDSVGKLKIIDLILDEESIMENYKSQFNETITKNNFKELISRLENNLKKVPGKSTKAEKI